jgi:peptidoglycan/LPS O-acetylase OafA/YrhL
MKYKSHIDGLRAVAVFLVVFFHAGFSFLKGGFVGVDVFFVISGYLITSLIITEKDSGTFSLKHFYERRARRILPALFFVMFVSLPLAWFSLLPSELKSFSESLIATTSFLSNIYFLKTSSYFDSASELKPLLHTWSLAIEEQYYLIFPLLILLFWKLGKRKVILILFIIFCLSLALAQMESINHPLVGFYGLTTRCWEFLIGAFGAFYGDKIFYKSKYRAKIFNLVSFFGFFLILYSALTFSKLTPYPSLYTLFPTFGTFMIVLCATPNTLIGRLLSLKILTGSGLISYSIYLWHQPLLAFARQFSLGKLSSLSIIFVIGITILLAYLTWRFIERPFRDQKKISRQFMIYSVITAGAVLLFVSFFCHLKKGFVDRLPPNINYESLGEKLDADGEVCKLHPDKEFSGVNACYFGDLKASKVVALYGDSHAQAISYELNAYFIENKIKGMRVSAEGCNTIPKIYDNRNISASNIENCKNSYANFLKFVEKKASEIVIISRWTFRLYPIPGMIDDLNFDNLEGGVEWNEYREYVALNEKDQISSDLISKKYAVYHFLNSIAALKIKTIIIGPVPEVGWNIAKKNFLYFIKNKKILPEISTSYQLYRNRNQVILNIFENFSSANVFFVQPENLFCKKNYGRCFAQEDGVPMYYDDDHLSNYGSQMLVDEIFKY